MWVYFMFLYKITSYNWLFFIPNSMYKVKIIILELQLFLDRVIQKMLEQIKYNCSVIIKILEISPSNTLTQSKIP